MCTGINPENDSVAVGLRVKDSMDGIHYVGPPDCLRNLPIPMITLAKVECPLLIDKIERFRIKSHFLLS